MSAAYNNQNEPHYYRPQDEDSSRQANQYRGTDERGAASSQRHDGHEEEAEACMHPMHMAVCFFSFLSVVFCAIALGTPSSYVVSTNTTLSFGIFRQCVDKDCGGIKYQDFNSTQCEIRKASSWQNRQLMSQLAIIFGCVFSLAAVGLSFTGKVPGITSILLIVMTALAFIFILLGVLRLIYTYEIWLFCDMNFCKLARSDSSITNANLSSSGCEAGYGYSFALLVISTGGMFFSMIFAIMRMAFKDWYLRKVVDDGPDERGTAQPVYAAQPAANNQQETRAVPMEEHNGQQQQEQQQQQQGDDQWDEPKKTPARSPARTPGSKTPPPKRSPGRTPGKSPARSPRQRSPARGPGARSQTPGRSPQRTPQARTPVHEERAAPPQDDDMPPGDWVFDEEAGLYWSAEEYLYLDPNTKHYFDPNSEKWFNPDTQEWYDGVPQ